jgi:hypothetical protein
MSPTASPTMTESTVADSATKPATEELRRPVFFDGQFLRASQLTAEQDYLSKVLLQTQLAGGVGVAHGLSLSGEAGTVRVTPGVGFVSSGMLYLPHELHSDIATLVAKATGDAASSKMLRLQLDADSIDVRDDVMFGLKCAEDCSGTTTSTSYRLETVALSVAAFVPSLPVATVAPNETDAKWLRSRLASAHFRGLDKANSLRNGAGLRSILWCRGNDLDTLAALPVGVLLYVDGSWICDPWIVRRERCDSPAEQYWAQHMGMRPHQLFLAQVLQFQCQLSDALGGVGHGSAEALEAEAQAFLNDLNADGANPLKLIQRRMLPGFAPRVGSAEILAGDNVLHNLGFVELPPAGFIPIDPSSDEPLVSQVERWFGVGPGRPSPVELEFVGVREAEIGQAIDEALHLERIPLWSPKDDPKPKVTIYIPDGIQQPVPPPPSPNLYSGWIDLGVVPVEGEESSGVHLRLASLVRFDADAKRRSGRFVLLGVGCRPWQIDDTRPYISDLPDLFTSSSAVMHPIDPLFMEQVTTDLREHTVAGVLAHLQGHTPADWSSIGESLTAKSLVAVWMAVDLQPGIGSKPPSVTIAEARFFEFPSTDNSASPFDATSAEVLGVPIGLTERPGGLTISAKWQGLINALLPVHDLTDIRVSATISDKSTTQVSLDNLNFEANGVAYGQLSLVARVADSKVGVTALQSAGHLGQAVALPIAIRIETVLELLSHTHGTQPSAAFVDRATQLLLSQPNGNAPQPPVWSTSANYVAFTRSRVSLRNDTTTTQ